jgi:zinc protease
MLSVGIFAAVPAPAQEWQQIEKNIPKLPPFHPQEPKRIAFPNGMVFFLQEDHELPLIDATARIRGGSRAEPAAKTGLVALLGEVWRTGGTKTKTGDQLDDYLEIRAAKVETAGGGDSTDISLSCLKDDFDDVFAVFTDLLQNPEFRADKLDLAKREAFDAISRRNDEISQIASREAGKLAYGSQNPYVRQEEYSTIDAITRQDLIDWHDRYVHPNNIIFGIVGDFDSARMEAKLRKAFGDWAKGPAAVEPDIQFTPAKPGYYFIKKEDVNQSSIRMVGLGTKRKNPDYYAIEVFNEALGGGFASRLIQSIRTAEGLAYAVGGGVGTRFDHPGILQLAMSTKSSTTVHSIEALDEQIDLLKTKPITDQEIAQAKDSILNAFVFNFDTPDKVLRERMAYEFYGYPPDFLEKYRAGIEKVTTADVNRVALKYMYDRKDQLAVLVVGKPEDFDKPLSSLGPVTNVDITIPPPPGEKSEQPESQQPAEKKASNPEGKALAEKVVQALGGLEKVKSVKAVKADFTLTQLAGPMQGTVQVESTLVFPDRMRVDLHTPQGSFSMVVTPDSGFMAVQGRGVQDMPSSRRDETLAQLRRDLVNIAQHVDDPAYSFVKTGTDKAGEKMVDVVDVSGPGVSFQWFVDPETGRVVSTTYKSMGQSGMVDSETDFSDWRPVEGGLNLPFHRDNKQEGKDSSSAQFTSFQINPQIDPKFFEKPEAPAPAQ